VTAWSAQQYVKFEDERSRPAVELLARVPLDHPRRVIDIGCGPGNSTEILLARYPEAEIIGLDSSPEMLAAARRRLPAVSFVEADVAGWTPQPSADLLFSNATFQWVRGHGEVLKRLLATMRPGGVIAMQVPDNLTEPTHRLMQDVALEGPWQNQFARPIEREEILPASGYYDLLKPLAASVDIWTTIYNHPLADASAILEWFRATGLRPYLARLTADEQSAYLADYLKRLAKAYPPLVDGRVLLRFPRLFLVAVRQK
jgi:trans-aconitate 2-methyltransferase